jgi:predicted flap endonuclease-1-like 5' DNA nuclease
MIAEQSTGVSHSSRPVLCELGGATRGAAREFDQFTWRRGTLRRRGLPWWDPGAGGWNRERLMSYAIMDIKGIGPLLAEKLKKVGIRTTEKLLETAKSAKGRKELAAKIGVDEKTILRWANLADRMRIKGIGEDYAELLKVVGVDTVKELKHRNVAKLASAMREANKKNKFVRLLPSERRVQRWVDQARKLELKITY